MSRSFSDVFFKTLSPNTAQYLLWTWDGLFSEKSIYDENSSFDCPLIFQQKPKHAVSMKFLRNNTHITVFRSGSDLRNPRTIGNFLSNLYVKVNNTIIRITLMKFLKNNRKNRLPEHIQVKPQQFGQYFIFTIIINGLRKKSIPIIFRIYLFFLNCKCVYAVLHRKQCHKSFSVCLDQFTIHKIISR